MIIVEPTNKCYKVTCWCTTKVNYYVYTDNKEDDEKLVKRGEYHDKEVVKEIFEEVISCTEEDD